VTSNLKWKASLWIGLALIITIPLVKSESFFAGVATLLPEMLWIVPAWPRSLPLI
jgi:hypothetical protein